MTISVIVPVGRGDFLEQCRASLRRSIARCTTCAADWDVIEIFDDRHKGVAWARNEGLKKAKGDWVAWVDCDDVVDVRWAEVIARNIEKEAASSTHWDVLAFGAVSLRGARRIEMRLTSSPRVMPAFEFLRRCLLDMMGSTWLWNKVFRRALFHDSAFEGLTQEDFRIMPRLLSRAGNVAVIPELLYEYQRPPGSLTSNGGGRANAEGIIAAVNDGLSDVDGHPALDDIWREGCALRAADWLYHAGYDAAVFRFLKENVQLVMLDREQGVRVKVKCVLALVKSLPRWALSSLRRLKRPRRT